MLQRISETVHMALDETVVLLIALIAETCIASRGPNEILAIVFELCAGGIGAFAALGKLRGRRR